MKSLVQKVLLFLSFLMITSCSLAPFSATTSGQSYGKGKIQGEVGNANSNYFVKLGAGMTENFDLGYVMEFGNFSTSSIFAKYSFINNETGPSLAGEFGYGSSDTTNFYYAGTIGSIAFSKNFELFGNIRVNTVNADETDIEIGDSIGNVELEKLDVTYLYGAFGFNLWMTENTGLSIYTIYITGEGISVETPSTVGGSILINF